MKKKYLFLINSKTMGGAERHVMDLLQHIDYGKNSVTWAVAQNCFSDYLGNIPVEVVNLPNTSGNGITKKFIKYYKFFKKALPDSIIMSQFWLKSFSLPEVLAGYLVSKGNLYMIAHDCAPQFEKYESKKHLGFLPGIGLEWRRERFFQKTLIYFTKCVVAVSEEAKSFLMKFHNYPERKLSLSYHGVEIEKFKSSLSKTVIARKNLKIPDTAKVITAITRLHKIKRLERLLEAFAFLARERKDIYLLIAGTGKELNSLLNFASALENNIKERINFLGFRKDVLSILQASDIFVLPSDSEGLPISLLEAMSCGLLCVATNCGGIPEVIIDGENGFLVEKSPEGVIEGIKEALDLTEVERNRISKNAKETIETKFNLRNNANYTLSLFGIKH